jgi:multiple antibiotic resistance protein
VASELVMSTLTAFATVFAIVDPLATAPIFLAITPGNTEEERRRMAAQASLVAGGVLLLFALTGNRIFTFFGISTPAFRVAGGILLLVTALETLRSGEGGKPQTPEEKRESVEKPDVAITPLAIPLLAGPGAISTVALLGSNAKNAVDVLIVGGAIVLTLAIAWVALANAGRLVKIVGRIGLKIVTRIMGLLLAGIGVEFILAGIRQFWSAG